MKVLKAPLQAQKYAVINTLIDADTTLKIDQLNGTQGDNKRLVSFAIKDGGLPHDLSNQKIEIRVVDHAGVLKTVTEIHDVLSPAAGMITMVVPGEVYQAVGEINYGVIKILGADDTVISTNKITFEVVEDPTNKAADIISEPYIDQVTQLIQGVSDTLAPIQEAVAASKNEMTSLANEVTTYTNLVNSTRPDDKLEYMALSMTYSENEPQRYTDVLDRYKGTVSTISLIDMLNISSGIASDVTSSPVAMLQAKIDEAKAAGYKINLLKPHVGPNRSDGFTKYKYVPDNIDTFFARYKTILLDHAKLCVDNSIPVLSISNELNQIIGQNYLSYWQDIVSAIRSAYPTLKLTAAIAGPYTDDQQVLYPLVDYIGVNWYPAYTYKLIKKVSDIPSEAELGQGLLYSHINDSQNPDGKSDLAIIASLAKKYSKPIWITESGVMPKPDGLNHLLSSQMDAPDMFEITAAALHTFFDNVATIGSVAGISWWHGQEPFNLGPINVSAKTVAEKAWENLEGEYLIK